MKILRLLSVLSVLFVSTHTEVTQKDNIGNRTIPADFVQKSIKEDFFNNSYGKVHYISKLSTLTLENSYYIIISNEVEYIPGSIMHKINSSYVSNAYNEKGELLVNLNPFGYSNSYYRNQDYCPKNGSNYSTTVYSGFNGGATIGVSSSNGFYIDGALKYQYQTSVTNVEPVFSSQNHAYNEYSFFYDYTHAANETYHLNSYISFELSKSIGSSYTYAIDIDMTVYQDHFFNWEQELYPISHDIIYITCSL